MRGSRSDSNIWQQEVDRVLSYARGRSRMRLMMDECVRSGNGAGMTDVRSGSVEHAAPDLGSMEPSSLSAATWLGLSNRMLGMSPFLVGRGRSHSMALGH